MAKLDIALVTNMTTPYRAPFYEALAALEEVNSLRVYTCVAREYDRQWDVKQARGYDIKKLWGFTLNLAKGTGANRILHLRFGIFWQLLFNRPSIVVIGDASWTSFLTVLACLLLRLKYVVWSEITTSSKISYGLAHRFRLWMYRYAAHIVAACTLARNYLLNNGVPEESITVINNAVDNNYFLKQKHRKGHMRDQFRAQLGIRQEAYCYLYVGQLVSRKRVIETVEYVAEQAKFKPCHLLVVGSGLLENDMRSKADALDFSSITFCGYANQGRLCELYIASDCLVLLSEDEPWGMVVSEALLFGLECVLSESVGAKDLLSQELGGVSLDNLPSPSSMASRFISCLEAL